MAETNKRHSLWLKFSHSSIVTCPGFRDEWWWVLDWIIEFINTFVYNLSQ
jgi:hypothetical protein